MDERCLAIAGVCSEGRYYYTDIRPPEMTALAAAGASYCACLILQLRCLGIEDLITFYKCNKEKETL